MADERRTKYTLKHSIKDGDRTITELHFREPKAKDLYNMPLENRTMRDIFDVLAQLCVENTPVIGELHPEDVKGITSLISVF